MKNLPVCSTSEQPLRNLCAGKSLLRAGAANFCASFDFSLGKSLRSNARLGRRGSLVVPWIVVVSPCPSGAQQAKGWVEMAQMRHLQRCEAVLHLAAFVKWPQEVSGDAYGLVHLKMSFTTQGLKISALNHDLLYLPVCKGKIKQKILVHEQCLEWLCVAKTSHPK